jgi:poly-gamma-glutamate synthesis protein (capsule biosynthesis protein)
MGRLSLLTLTLVSFLSAPPVLAQAPAASVTEISDAIWNRMQGRSWHADLPCAPRAALAMLTLPYRDFSGAARQGTLVVARDAARQVAAVFREIFDSGQFRIARMRPIDDYDGDDDASMADDNTSGFNCRRVDGDGGLSKHARGLAIDINPIENPYRTAQGTDPPAGRAYDTDAKRRADVIGLIRRGDVVTRAFARIGWSWGGDFKTIKDWQHFAR